MIKNVNDHDNPVIEKPEDYSLDTIGKIIDKASTMQYGYTTIGDCIQIISEALDIPENIAEYLLQQYRKVENCKSTIRKVNSIIINLNQDLEKKEG